MRVIAHIYYPISDPLSPAIDPALEQITEELPKLAKKLGAVDAVIVDAAIITSDNDKEDEIF
jgi:hypothetical protein